MFSRLLTGALIAGCAAGLLAAFLHFAFVQNLILLGEGYETGALHAHGAEVPAHAHGAPEAGSDLSRNGLTVAFSVLLNVAYALVLLAGFALAESFGHRIGPKEGLLWGVAGFAAWQLAPAMGLPPELPGTLAADLGARQVWWWGTAAATAAGLGLLAYGPGVWRIPAAAALLALPHLIGAPHPESFAGTAPPELAGAFAARALGVGLVVWAALGALGGHLWAAAPRDLAARPRPVI